jgi:hypothetical protein
MPNRAAKRSKFARRRGGDYSLKESPYGRPDGQRAGWAASVCAPTAHPTGRRGLPRSAGPSSDAAESGSDEPGGGCRQAVAVHQGGHQGGHLEQRGQNLAGPTQPVPPPRGQSILVSALVWHEPLLHPRRGTPGGFRELAVPRRAHSRGAVGQVRRELIQTRLLSCTRNDEDANVEGKFPQPSGPLRSIS